MRPSSSAPPDAPELRRLKRNPVLLTVHHALMMTLFPMAILTLFQRDHLGLTVAQVMWVQACFGGILAIFEFPSGYLADRIGYRPTLILASLISIVAWTIYSTATGLTTVLLAEGLMGLGLSLVSGTNSAMLFESLDGQGRSQDFGRWYARSRSAAQFAEGSAALAAGLLFSLSVRLPFYLMIGIWVINLGVALALVEPRYAKKKIDRPIAHILSLVRFVASGAPRLRALFAVGIVIGVANFIPVWLVQLYAVDGGVPVEWLGPIWAAANYFVAIGSMLSNRLAGHFGFVPLLVGCCGLIGIGYFGMGGTHAWWGFVFYFAFNVSRGLAAPLLANAEQEEIPSGDRASLVSMRSLMFRLGFIALGPVTGILIDAHGQHVVLLGLGVCFVGLGLAGAAHLARVDAKAGPAAPAPGA